MNKTYKILNIITLAGLIALAILFFSRKEKYGYIDNVKLISNYKGFEEANAQIKQKSMQWQANIDTLTMDINKAVFEFKRDSLAMSSKQREDAQNKIVYLQKQLIGYKASIQQIMKDEDEKITKQILLELNSFVADYAKKHRYTIIWGATSVGNIVYADEGKNITEDILKELNKK